jgi:hypothetical protein
MWWRADLIGSSVFCVQTSRPVRPFLPRLLPLLPIAMCLSQPVLAQINPFRGRATVSLRKDDISELTGATNHLLGRTGRHWRA